jgi:hypothetical protein
MSLSLHTGWVSPIGPAAGSIELLNSSSKTHDCGGWLPIYFLRRSSSKKLRRDKNDGTRRVPDLWNFIGAQSLEPMRQSDTALPGPNAPWACRARTWLDLRSGEWSPKKVAGRASVDCVPCKGDEDISLRTPRRSHVATHGYC